ncbi:hypothetical protein R75483_06122 [Paraburkholderia domus]|nr:hypothetical protein R75483_06122 [Paraburkholderia domus]
MMLWGCLSWSISPIVQNYLIRSAPDQADVSIGINVSAMHLGVALGAGLGGLLVDSCSAPRARKVEDCKRSMERDSTRLSRRADCL